MKEMKRLKYINNSVNENLPVESISEIKPEFLYILFMCAVSAQFIYMVTATVGAFPLSTPWVPEVDLRLGISTYILPTILPALSQAF